MLRLRVAFFILHSSFFTLACNPGPYPVDIFPEMHYQPSYRPLEPERLTAPADAVPITGAAATYTWAQATGLQNPSPSTSQTLEAARQVYRVNCATCHGAAGDGRGPLAPYYERNSAAVVPPVAFTSQRVRARTDGQLYWIVRYGLGNMPPYDKLLTEEQVWLTVSFVRAVQGP